jgi:hypothetical protein
MAYHSNNLRQSLWSALERRVTTGRATCRYKAGADWRIAGTATSPPGTIISICTGGYCGTAGASTIVGLTPFRTVAGATPTAPADWTVSALLLLLHLVATAACGGQHSLRQLACRVTPSRCRTQRPITCCAPATLQVRLTKNAVPNLSLGTPIYISSSGGGKATSNTAGRRRRQLL